MLGRKAAFCSSVPYCMIVGPTVLMVRKGTGAPARCASSKKMNCSMAERPWPPNSDAQPAVAAQLQRQLAVGTAAGLAVRHRRLDLGRHHVCEVGTQLVAELLLLVSEG